MSFTTSYASQYSSPTFQLETAAFDTEKAIAQRVGELCKDAKLSLASNEKISLSLDAQGKIVVLSDDSRVSQEKLDTLQKALEKDDTLLKLLQKAQSENVSRNSSAESQSENTGKTIVDVLSISEEGREVSQQVFEQQEMMRQRRANHEALQTEWNTWNNDVSSRYETRPGAEALRGHGLLDLYAGKLESGQSTVDEYGYSNNLPVSRKEPPGSLPVAAGDLRFGGVLTLADGTVIDYDNMSWEETQKRMASNTVKPEAVSHDSVGLYGLSLDERKSFLDNVQELIDKSGLDLNARKLQFIGSNGSQQNAVDGVIAGVVVTYGGQFQTEEWASQLQKLGNMISSDRELMQLMQKSYDFTSGKSWGEIAKKDHEYTLKIVDNNGNRLADDQLIIESGNGTKQLQMSLEEFEQLDRKQITELLQTKGTTVQQTNSTENRSGITTTTISSTFKADTESTTGTTGASTTKADKAEETKSKNAALWGSLASNGSLAKLLGIGYGNSADQLKTLAASIDHETTELQKSIQSALKSAGVSMHVMDRLSIDVDSNGKLVLGGIKDKKTLAKIEKALAQDEKLGDRLTALAAKKEVLNIFEKGDAAIDQFANSAKYDDLKARLLKGYMNENDVDLTKIKSSEGVLTDSDGKLTSLLSELPGLSEDVTRLFDEKRLEKETEKARSTDARKWENAERTDSYSMFVFQNGHLLDQNVESESELTSRLQSLLGIVVPGHKDELRMGREITIGEAISLWNAENGTTPENQIHDFKLVVDERGNYSVTDFNAGAGESAGQSGKMVLQSWLTSAFGEKLSEIATGMFETHQAQHGDVEDYKHEAEVQFSGGFFSYEMRSDEADAAALADIEEKTTKIGESLTDFFQAKFATSHPDENWDDHFESGIEIKIGENGKLSMDIDSLNNGSKFLGFMQNTLEALNERLMSDDPFAETGFMSKLDPQLNGTLKELVAVQSDLKRIHDPQKMAAVIQIG